MTIEQIKQKAKTIRREILKMLIQAGSGHPAGSLAMADIFAALYFAILNHQPKKPDWPDRDRLILSAGHIIPVWYATLAIAGYFPIKELATLRQINSRLQGHPRRRSVPGVENTAGPLGQGISVACGVALAARLKQMPYRVFCITSDGEQQEGQTWEAYQFASQYRLNNLTFILDRNQIQISGRTEKIMPLEPLAQKHQAFGLAVTTINGHNIAEFRQAINLKSNQPKMIIANNIPSKGVKFMEGDYQWHGKVPKGEAAAKALAQLN